MKKSKIRPAYGIEQHNHNFAAWAASRAASVKGCRFWAGESDPRRKRVWCQFLWSGHAAVPEQMDKAQLCLLLSIMVLFLELASVIAGIW